MPVNYLMVMLEKISIKYLKQFKMKFTKPKKLAQENNVLTTTIKDFMIPNKLTSLEMKQNLLLHLSEKISIVTLKEQLFIELESVAEFLVTINLIILKHFNLSKRKRMEV